MNNQAAQTMPESVADALSVVNEAANRERHAGNYEHANSLVRARVALAKFALSQTAGVVDGWLRACDEEMVGAHLGVANASDDYATAKKKLNDLITWHIQVASDQAVNGGFVLVPVEPTEAMAKAGESAWPPIKNACCPWPQPEDVYAAMLAAAPAASGGESPSAASVSERARAIEMLAQEVEKDMTACADDIRAGKLHGMADASVRAIIRAMGEQALTQQRGAVDWLAFAYELEAFKPRGELGALHGAGMAFAYKDVAKTIRAKLATTTPQPGAEALRELTEATQALLHAVCGETGFAAAVRAHSGISYPWPALDIAEERVRSVLESLLAGGGGK